MKSSIFIPKKINVGYQNRSDTYTGKLAYVIYYDEKGKLRKEASWNSWRDDSIPNTEFDNVPIEGFVLNKHAGGVENSWGWNARKSYCRVYDPRGFEFEISIENLLYILENATSTKGKGLEGEFIYGWDGKDLVLMPIESPDYKSIIEYNNIVHSNSYIKAKDLKIGATYLDKNNCEFIYMGRFDRYCKCYKKAGKWFESKYKMERYCENHDIEPDDPNRYYNRYNPDEVSTIPYEKCHVFYYEYKNWNGHYDCGFVWHKSISNKFIGCKTEECISNYADLFYLLEGNTNYSPIDDSKDEKIYYTFEEFSNKEFSWHGTYVYSDLFNSIEVAKIDEGYIIKENELANKLGFKIVRKNQWSTTRDMVPVPLEQIFDKLKPYYVNKYLANGRFLEMEG